MRRGAGSIVAWLRQRLRDLRYLFGDLIYAIGRALRSIGRLIWPLVAFAGHLVTAAGRGIAAGWRGLSLVARRRLVAALVAAAAIFAFLEVAVPALPCQLPAGDRCPPADNAAELIPADSLAYVHVNLDPETEQFEELKTLAARVPLFAQQLATRALTLIPGPAGSGADYASDVDPWFTGEGALAILGDAAPSPEQVVLFEIGDPEGASAYAESIAAGTPTEEDYRGVTIRSDERDLASAEVEDFLVVGSLDGLRAIIDTATDAEGSASLADDELAESVREELPEHRFAEAWISGTGVADLIGGDSGTVGTLAPFFSPGTSEGAAAALTAAGDTLELAIRSELDPEREETSPGFFAAFPSFDPRLPETLPASSLAYLGFGEPRSTVTALLDQAAAQAPAIATGFAALVERLRSGGDVEIENELLPALGDEAAVAVGAESGSETPGGGLPFLEFIAAGVEEDAARRALAALQGAVVDEVGISEVQAPVFQELEIAGIDAQSLRVSPNVELTYAVFEGLVAVATNPAAIAQLAGSEEALESRKEYQRATEDFPETVSLLAFLDLRALLTEGFEIGLAQVPAFNSFAEDFRRLDALGLSVAEGDELLATDARVLFGDADEDALTSSPDD